MDGKLENHCIPENRPLMCIDCKDRETIYTNHNSGYIICNKYGKINYNFNILSELKKTNPSMF